MCLYIGYVNDQVNNKQKVENNGTKQGEWWSSNARNTRTGTRKIDCINLGSLQSCRQKVFLKISQDLKKNRWRSLVFSKFVGCRP